MSPEHLAVIMFVGVLALVLSGVHIYLALAGLGLYFGIIGGWAPQVYDQFLSRIYGLVQNPVLPAVPLFVFMGAILSHSGSAERLFDTLYRAIGRVRGGLAHATILICTIFAATAGVVGATETTVGLMALPAMLKRGYNKCLAAGAICAGGTLGIIIPPSVMLLLYGPTANLSVAKLFIAAIFPGVLLSGLYLLYIFVLCWIKPEYGPTVSKEELPDSAGKVLLDLLINLLPPVFLIFMVLGTILLGVASPTEAASIGAFGGIIVAACYKNLSLRVVYDSAIQTLKISSMVLYVSVGATMFSGVFMGLGGADYIGELVINLNIGKWGILGAMMISVIILGMFIDWIGVLFITIPIFNPIATQLGFDPMWFAMVVCVNLQMSFLTPPFAYSMFYLKGIAPPELTMIDIYKGVIPFVLLQLVAMIIVILFPALSLFLPGLM